MHRELFNIDKNRWLLVVPGVVFIWHALYVYFFLDPQYLLFICYPANLILLLGIAIRNRYLVGVGFGWVLVALPLWMYSVYLNPVCDISCILFHIVGVLAGTLAVRQYPLPGNIWIGGVLLGFIMQYAARVFTESGLNINAAFRVYEGWEGVFTNYTVYILVSSLLFALYFFLLPIIMNSIFHKTVD